ncbi:sensor histidine kinase [Paenibacillus sp. MBLB4367]|uniref:sensor histidine kinase n=1 Tax=Paenibacillus sp. MBLB4367 TaxID=3384767 RepID=UPI0039081FCC
MFRKLFYSIRWKILSIVLMSAVLAIGTTLLLIPALQIASRIGLFPFTDIVRTLTQTYDFSVFLLLALTAFFFFIVYMLILTQRMIRYLVKITEAVQQIADGRFDRRVPVNSKDELGELAENINRMTMQLKTSLEEERRAERTKAELITNVSHDLRTPLTSLTGYLGLIEQDRYRDEVELRHYVQIAYEKSQRLTVLVNDLFEYTRASGGGIKLNRSAINLAEMLGQLTVQYRHPLQEAGLEALLHVPETKVIVPADGDKLVRVFENLLVNAIHYGNQGKTVDVHVRTEASAAIVEVVNYGEPIPESDIPHLFDRFYRVEKSRAEHTGGSGLGLAIAKTIVELHGGVITVQSDRCRTSFEVRLPLGLRR